MRGLWTCPKVKSTAPAVIQSTMAGISTSSAGQPLRQDLTIARLATPSRGSTSGWRASNATSKASFNHNQLGSDRRILAAHSLACQSNVHPATRMCTEGSWELTAPAATRLFRGNRPASFLTTRRDFP
jgi:hypothetical protein